MPRFNVKAPDGSVIPVNAPEGATEQDAIAFAASIYQPKEPVAAPSIPSKSEALPEAPVATDEELAAAARPSFGNPNLIRQGESMRAQRSGSVMTSKVPTIAPESKVIDPEFINRVQANLDALPVEKRADALKRLSAKDDVYGKAAKIVADRYAAMEQAPQIVRDVGDFRAENQVSKFTKQGSNLDAAQVYARTQAQRGQPTPQFQQLTNDIVGERADKAAAEQKQSLADAGFAERVGAGAASQLKAAGYGLVEAYADLLGTKLISNYANEQSRIGGAETKAIPHPDNIALNSLQSAMTSLTTQAPVMALSAVTGTAVPTLAFAAINQFGQSYADGKQAGLTPGQAFSRAVPMAAAEVFFEKFGMTKALSGLKAHVATNGLDSIPAYMAKSIATEIPAELATTATQYLVDVLPEIGTNKNPSLMDLYKQLEETLRQTVLQSGVTAGVTSGGGKAYQAAKELQYKTPEDKFARALQQDIDARDFIPESAGLQAVQRLSPGNAQLTSNERFTKPVSPVLTGQQPAPLTEAPEAPLVEPPAPPVVAQNETPDLIQADKFEKPPAVTEPTSIETPAVEAPVVEPTAPVTPEVTRSSYDIHTEIRAINEEQRGLLRKDGQIPFPNSKSRKQYDALSQKRQQLMDEFDVVYKAEQKNKVAPAPGVTPTVETSPTVVPEAQATGKEKTAPETVVPEAEAIGKEPTEATRTPKEIETERRSVENEMLGLRQKNLKPPIKNSKARKKYDALAEKYNQLSDELNEANGNKTVVKEPKARKARRKGTLKSPILQLIVESGGISTKLKEDFGMGNVFLGGGHGPLFRTNGMAEDGIAELLQQNGHIFEHQLTDMDFIFQLIKDEVDRPRSSKAHSNYDETIRRWEENKENDLKQEQIRTGEMPITIDQLNDDGYLLLSDEERILVDEIVQNISEDESIDAGEEPLSLAEMEKYWGVSDEQKNDQEQIGKPDTAAPKGSTEGSSSGRPSSVQPKDFGLTGQTEEEIRADKAKADKEEKKTKRETVAKDKAEKEERDRKDIENRSKKTEFNLTPTDEVTKEEQAAIDKKAAENDLAGQGDMLSGKAQDFKVGDSVRIGNTAGVIISVDGDFVKVHPINSDNPKAYQRVQKATVTFISRPNQSATQAKSEFGEFETELNINKEEIVQRLGQNMYGSALSDIVIKEGMQNSFDAIKGQIYSKYGTLTGKHIGHLEIIVDRDKRTITLKDDGTGMTPDVVNNAFLTIAGSDKAGLPPELSSGGLGMAKMGVLMGASRIQLETISKGKVTTLDVTSTQLAAQKFKLNVDPAPKNAHGTTLTLTIPETFTKDNGDIQDIYFPRSAKYIESLNKPLIGPIEVKYTNVQNGTTEIIETGVNFDKSKYQKVKIVSTDFGKIEVYFGIERKKYPSHTVLSSGVYQFTGRGKYDDYFKSNKEMIPYDIVINVLPNVLARSSDYPFENNREKFKDRVKPDIDALEAYLSAINRGEEAKNLKEGFSNIVSMPRIEAGTDLAENSKKLKKAFDKRGQEETKELPSLPNEVKISSGEVIDTRGRVVARNPEAEKKAEKENKLSLKADEALPDMSTFMADMKEDPLKPIFHNNTNVDYLAIGKPFGNPEAFFAELGTLMVEMKEDLAKSGMYGYDSLSAKNLFFGGISIDRGYGGIHIKIPFRAVLFNPFYDWGGKTLFGIRANFYETMTHEIAHMGDMSHGVGHNTEMIKVRQHLADSGMEDYFRDALLDILVRHESTFTAMREAYGNSTTANTSKSFNEYEENSPSASPRGSEAGVEGESGSVRTRGQQGGGGNLQTTGGTGKQSQVSGGAGGASVANDQLMRSFEGTKVADEQGRPIVVYHGTTAHDDYADEAGQAFSQFASKPTWLAKEPYTASGYSKGTGSTYPVYALIKNPLTLDFDANDEASKAFSIARKLGVDVDQMVIMRNPKSAWEVINDPAFVDAAEKAGYDGLFIKESGYETYGVFDSSKIKSAIGNRGTYDMSNPSILENIDYSKADPELFHSTDRLSPDAQQILVKRRQEYAKLRRQIVEINKKIRTTGGTLDLQKLSNELHAVAEELKNGLARISAPDVTAENFLNQARKALDGSFPFKGQALSQEVFDVIQAAYNKEPWLLNGLRLSVREGAGGRSTANFRPFKRIVTLFSGTSGTTNPVSVRHELAHSMEQMMTALQRKIVVDAWMKDLDKRLKDSKPGSKELIFFEAVVQYLSNPSIKNQKLVDDTMPGYEYYQFTSPSEYWAVNAEPLLNQQLGGSWEKFKKAMSRLFEGLKKVFGFDNKYDIHKVFKEILGGDRKRLNRSALVNFVYASNPNGEMLNNIQDDERLIVKYNRPNTPMVDLTPVRTGIVNLAKGSKDVFKEVVRDPASATKRAVTGLDHALLRARNREIFFGAGLNAEDLARYKGEMRVSSGLATASVAVDNALRGWTMASQVIMNGGIEYNARNLNFVSVKKAMGMAGVYKAEMAIKKRIGNQLGTDIIQGYLEAKRSLSIKNEVDARQLQVDDLLDQLANMPPNTAPDIVEAVRADYEEAVNDLKAINLVERKVSMSDAEISDFIDRESEHPELKDIMDNWTAVNQNMLSFWRQVGLLSQARYDLLSNIKDYVPWNRIMEGDATTSGYAAESSVSSSTKSMTNIGQEKVFKSGKPSVQTEFIAKAGQDTFQINPSTVVRATVAGVKVNPANIISAPNGQVRITVPIAEGDIVSFKANREIENIIDNMTRSVMRMTMNGLRQYAAMRIVSEYATRNDKNMIRVFPKVDEAEGTFNFVANGRNIVVQIKDKHIADAIYGLHSIDLVMFKPLIAMANLLRRGITLSAIFQFKQVFKDAPTAAIVTGVKRPDLLIGGVFKGLVTTALRPMLNAAGSKLTGRDLDIEPVVKILQEAGIGGFQSPSRTPEAEVKLRLGLMNRNVVSFVLKALDHIGDSSDMAQRVAVYKRVLKETGDEAQALYQAANVINFLHRGYGAEAQFLAKTVPFIGAYVNATDVVVQSLVGGGLKGMGRAKALQRLSVAGGMITAFTLLYMMLVSGDPDYEELDDQTKARNFIIPGTKIYFPINTPVGFLFKATAEIAYNHFINTSTETPKDATRMKTALKEAAIGMLAGPEPLPPPIKVAMEISLNHDFFTSRKVVPPGLENIDASEQYNDATSQAGKFLSNLTGNDKSRMLNPIEADHVIKGLFGTAGAMAMWLSNSIGEAAATRPATPSHQVPIIGAFTLPAVGRNREDLFYDLKQRVDQQYKTFEKQMERMKADKISNYTPEQQSLIAFHDYVSDSTTSLDEFNSLIRFVSSEANDSQTPKEKREMIEDIQRAKSDILTGVENFRVAAGL